MVVGVLGARVFRAVLRDVPSLTEKLLAGMARRLREADRIAQRRGRAATQALAIVRAGRRRASRAVDLPEGERARRPEAPSAD